MIGWIAGSEQQMWSEPDTIVVTDRDYNAPSTARIISPHVLCHTVSVNSHEIHAPSLGCSAAARRSAAGRSGS